MTSMLLVLVATTFPKVDIEYTILAKQYSTKPPKGFVEFSRRNGVEKPNTCAVRLSHALFEVDEKFFRDVKAKSGVEWLGLPTRAADLAIILNGKLGKAENVKDAKAIGDRRGVVFFDEIADFDGTGHISLWNGKAVVDGGDYFPRAKRVYFWSLPD